MARFSIIAGVGLMLVLSVNSQAVNSAIAADITATHNSYRSTVSPSAANMQRMYWSDELASLAQAHADNCVFSHDVPSTANFPSVGQNMGMGHQTWASVMSSWHSEKDNLNFGVGKIDSTQATGHYTQMVWASSSNIGCGWSDCGGTPIQVCNYAPAGNYQNSLYTPYVSSTTQGSGCANSVDADGLCDCGGYFCLNHGTLDINTCSCSCYDKPWINSADQCKVDCSVTLSDYSVCGTAWGQAMCDNYANVPFEYCPIFCGICAQ